MFAPEFPIEVTRGATYTLVLTWKAKEGNVYDLTGYTGEVTLRRGEKTLATLTPHILHSFGQITINIPPEVTQDLGTGPASYELRMTSPQNVVTVLLRGRVTFG